MEKVQYKFIRNIKIFSVVFAVLFVGYIIFAMIFGIDFFISLLIDAFFFLSVIVFTIYTVIYGVKAGKNYRKNLISTKPKQRFKYLDSFYYFVKVQSGDISDTGKRQMFVYHIIQELNSNKYYAIAEQNTNMRAEIKSGKTKLLRIDDIDGFSTRNDWKEANYNDEGTLWLDQELVGCYQNDGSYIHVKYFGEDHKIKIDGGLSNRNPDNNVALLDKCVFILGYAELDKKE